MTLYKVSDYRVLCQCVLHATSSIRLPISLRVSYSLVRADLQLPPGVKEGGSDVDIASSYGCVRDPHSHHTLISPCCAPTFYRPPNSCLQVNQ